ncbi:hypothetical protein MTO96_035947 [Rhipicephalus appendiculatus]
MLARTRTSEHVGGLWERARLPAPLGAVIRFQTARLRPKGLALVFALHFLRRPRKMELRARRCGCRPSVAINPRKAVRAHQSVAACECVCGAELLDAETSGGRLLERVAAIAQFFRCARVIPGRAARKGGAFVLAVRGQFARSPSARDYT